MKKRVVAAMSGGVDSSVSALLLKEQGYDVIGITMKLFDDVQGSSCCGMQGVEDARRAACRIGIPFYPVNFYRAFRNRVMHPFFSEYCWGRTPNPCVLCNQDIKFGVLHKLAEGLDAGYVGTGHYVRVEYSREKKRYILKKGKDPVKDQSYFLFSLSQKQLAGAMFPAGEYSKTEIRKYAKKKGLHVYNKPQSQDTCFAGKNYRRFITRYSDAVEHKKGELPFSPGPVVNEQGDTVGTHQGIVHYTVGQRKGIGAYGRPMYVKAIHAGSNTVVITEDQGLYSKHITVKRINWIDRDSLKEPISVTAKVRYGHEGSKARVFPEENGSVKVTFEKPERAVTPGQAVVLYDRDIVIGGGWIQ